MLVEDFWWAFLQLQFSVSDLLIEFICELGASFAQIVHAIVCQGSAKNPYLIDIFIIQLHLNSFNKVNVVFTSGAQTTNITIDNIF